HASRRRLEMGRDVRLTAGSVRMKRIVFLTNIVFLSSLLRQRMLRAGEAQRRRRLLKPALRSTSPVTGFHWSRRIGACACSLLLRAITPAFPLTAAARKVADAWDPAK